MEEITFKTNIDLETGWVIPEGQKPYFEELEVVTDQVTGKYFYFNLIVTLTDENGELIYAPATWDKDGMKYLHPSRLNGPDYEKVSIFSREEWSNI